MQLIKNSDPLITFRPTPIKNGDLFKDAKGDTLVCLNSNELSQKTDTVVKNDILYIKSLNSEEIYSIPKAFILNNYEKTEILLNNVCIGKVQICNEKKDIKS